MKRAATAREASARREQETEKRAAVQRAAGLIRRGVVVGLGSGIIVVDHTKCPPRLGTWHSVPLEVATFGWRPEALYLEALGAMVRLHRGDDGPVFRTDQGSWILDAGFGPIKDSASVAASLLSRAAIAEVGLSADYARLGEQIATAIDAGARRIHVDIMVGHFVPNLSFGPGTVSARAPIVHAVKRTVECHLIMTDPDRHLAGFARAGADVRGPDPERSADSCRNIGVRLVVPSPGRDRRTPRRVTR